MNLQGISQALSDGCRIHAFRSGGGLRVVRIEKNGELKGYGEHPNIEEALRYADEDYLLGGRPYSEVYGPEKTHYLTGSMEVTSPIDFILLRGHTFDAWKNGKDVVFQIKKLSDSHTPKKIVEMVLENGKSITWTNRGFVYRTSNEKGCTSTEIIRKRPNKGFDPWMYTVVKIGYGRTFWKAMESSLKAKEIEIEGL